jgi:peroxiredoxin Q/BCP
MAQLRQDYAKFQHLDAEVVAVGPDGPNAFRRFWESEQMPFIGLADVGSKVAELYNQEVNIFKLGRMPALLVVDKQGVIRYHHYGRSMADIPANSEVLEVLKTLVEEEEHG